MTAPNVLDTASPFWLRLYGKWVRLQGIMPVVEQDPGRAFNELVTVDGYRYEQRAPRGARSWTYDYRYGTAAATAALESAAYDFNADDPAMRTLFLDTDAAKVNMVEPDLVRRWQHPEVSPPFYVINVGESPDDPVWQPSYVVTVNDLNIAGIQRIPVRAGVTYTAAYWTAFPNAMASALTISVNAVVVASDAIAGGGTAANPELVTTTWTAAADGIAVIQINLNAMSYSAGLMFYEGDCPPDYYRVGQRMPCSISVHDPSRRHNLVWRTCDPCELPREHTSWVIREVGMDATTAQDFGVMV